MSFQAYLDNIKAKTGKTPDDFKALAEKKGLLKPGVKAGEILAWLKEDFGLGHGHAMAIYGVLTEVKSLKANSQEAIDKHFSGNKSKWHKLFDGLLTKMNKFGTEIQVAPTNSYLSLLRDGKKFAIVQVTADRMDVGIKLRVAEATDRLEPSGAWNAMVTHRVRINAPEQVDKELLAWLRGAYDQSGKTK